MPMYSTKYLATKPQGKPPFKTSTWDIKYPTYDFPRQNLFHPIEWNPLSEQPLNPPGREHSAERLALPETSALNPENLAIHNSIGRIEARARRTELRLREGAAAKAAMVPTPHATSLL